MFLASSLELWLLPPYLGQTTHLPHLQMVNLRSGKTPLLSSSTVASQSSLPRSTARPNEFYLVLTYMHERSLYAAFECHNSCMLVSQAALRNVLFAAFSLAVSLNNRWIQLDTYTQRMGTHL